MLPVLFSSYVGLPGELGQRSCSERIPGSMNIHEFCSHKAKNKTIGWLLLVVVVVVYERACVRACVRACARARVCVCVCVCVCVQYI